MWLIWFVKIDNKFNEISIETNFDFHQFSGNPDQVGRFIYGACLIFIFYGLFDKRLDFQVGSSTFSLLRLDEWDSQRRYTEFYAFSMIYVWLNFEHWYTERIFLLPSTRSVQVCLCCSLQLSIIHAATLFAGWLLLLCQSPCRASCFQAEAWWMCWC